MQSDFPLLHPEGDDENNEPVNEDSTDNVTPDVWLRGQILEAVSDYAEAVGLGEGYNVAFKIEDKTAHEARTRPVYSMGELIESVGK